MAAGTATAPARRRSSLVGLTVHGRPSGRCRFPAQYARRRPRLVVAPGYAERNLAARPADPNDRRFPWGCLTCGVATGVLILRAMGASARTASQKTQR